MRERKKLAATQRGDRRSRASMRSPLCRAPLTSVASDSLNLLCWTCPAGGDWACRGLAFFVPRNRRQFAPVLCPLCRLSDLRTFRWFHSAYPSRLMHPRTQRVFDGAGDRLGAKFLMSIGSTFAAIEPFGSVSLPECGLSISAMPLGTCDKGPCRVWRSFRDMRRSGIREQPQPGALCTRWPTTRSRSSRPSIWSRAGTANQRARRVCCWLRQVSWVYSTRILLVEKATGWRTCSKNRWEAGACIKCVLLEAAVPTAQRICPFHLSGVRAAGSSDGHSDIADWRALLHRLNDRDARPFA